MIFEGLRPKARGKGTDLSRYLVISSKYQPTKKPSICLTYRFSRNADALSDFLD